MNMYVVKAAATKSCHDSNEMEISACKCVCLSRWNKSGVSISVCMPLGTCEIPVIKTWLVINNIIMYNV